MNIKENIITYYISIGEKAKLYTLWRHNSFSNRDNFIKSLSRDENEALRKAEEYFNKKKEKNPERYQNGLLYFDDVINFETKDWNDYTTIPFGKYKGFSIENEEIVDINYKKWLFFSMLKNEDNENVKFFEALKNHLIETNIIVEFNNQYYNKEIYDKYLKGEYVFYNNELIPYEKYRRIIFNDYFKERSEFFGEEGEIFEGKVFLEKEFNIDTQFGIMYIVLFSTEDENVIVYKGSKPFSMKTGDVAYMKAKIKGHDEYNDIKQTQIKNPKLFSFSQFEELMNTLNKGDFDGVNDYDEFVAKFNEQNDDDFYSYIEEKSELPKKELKKIYENGIVKELFNSYKK